MNSPYLNTREAAMYLRFVNRDGDVGTLELRRLYEYLTRYQVRTMTRGGRSLLIHKEDLDKSLQERRTA